MLHYATFRRDNEEYYGIFEKSPHELLSCRTVMYDIIAGHKQSLIFWFSIFSITSLLASQTYVWWTIVTSKREKEDVISSFRVLKVHRNCKFLDINDSKLRLWSRTEKY